MHRSPVTDAFLRSSLFASVDGQDLEQLAELASTRQLAAGETLFRQGEPADAVYVVLDGQLQAVAEDGDRGDVLLGMIDPGDPVGELALLLGGQRSATIRATSPATLAKIPAQSLRPWLERSPALQDALEGLARERLQRNQLAAIVRRYFGVLDDGAQRDLAENLEWLTVAPGEILFRKGDPGDSLYIVVNGQLWAVGEDEAGNEVPIATLREQDVVGEMGLLSNEDRNAAVVAAQQSTLVRLSRTTFEALAADHPELMLTITRELIGKLRKTQRSRRASRGGSREIAVVAADPGMDTDSLIRQLALKLQASAAVIGRPDIKRQLGRADLADARAGEPGHVGLGVWLEEQACVFDMIFYLTEPLQGDGQATQWTRHCLSRADEVLIVADAGGHDEPVNLERALYRERQAATGLRKLPHTRLILLHEGEVPLPERTDRWLRQRSPEGYYHLRRKSQSDLERIARILENRAVGLLLGGQGPGSIAHLGALQALEEQGVVIDYLAGSGTATLVAALRASGRSVDEMKTALDWQRLDDRQKIPALCRDLFADMRIEDLWQPFSCASTNLSRQAVQIHRQGMLEQAVMAAMAVPGVHKPVAMGNELHVNSGNLLSGPDEFLRRHSRHCISIDSISSTGVMPEDLARPDGSGSAEQSLWSRFFGRRDEAGQRKKEHARLIETVMAGGSRAIQQLRGNMDLSIVLSVASGKGEAVVDTDALITQGYRQTMSRIGDLDLLPGTGRALS